MTGDLGAAIIGCGYMGDIHAESWDAHPHARVAAVVDIQSDRAQHMANVYQLDTYFTDYREVLELSDVDVVSICVPTSLHPEITMAAAEAGKHILCEKPVALKLEDAERMRAAAEAHGVILGTGFMRRHSQVLADLRSSLAEGLLGRPVMYHAMDIRELRPKREMHDTHTNGGPVIDMAVHLFDLWGHIFQSQPVEVFAQGLTIAADRPEIDFITEKAIDTASIVTRYASGDIGTFVVSWGLPPKVNPPEKADQLYGPKGLGEIYYLRKKQEFRIMKEGASWETISISHQNMYHNQAASFVSTILEGKPLSVPFQAGLDSLRVAQGAIESIQTGQPVFF
jgi:predicted dehydrogenase